MVSPNGTEQIRPPIRFSASKMVTFWKPFSNSLVAAAIPEAPAPTIRMDEDLGMMVSAIFGIFELQVFGVFAKSQLMRITGLSEYGLLLFLILIGILLCMYI